jgi:predicted dehydrogenase
MAKDKLKVAVVGVGMIANAAHIPAWKDLPDDVEIVAVMDVYENNAKTTAKMNGIPKWYTNAEKMLEECKPDIVSVCTPNCYHKQYSILALQAGAHVLCEKPVSTSAENAAEMFDVAEKAGKLLFVGQTARWSGTTLAAKEMADAGRLGEMYYAETAALRRRGVPKWGMFHMAEHNQGGPLYDIGVHSLDALLWIMGSPKVIAASGATYLKIANKDEGLKTSLADSGAPLGLFTPRPYDYKEFNVEDFGVGFLRLEGGATVYLKASWAANVPEGMGGTFIVGTEGGLKLQPLTYVTNMGSYQVDITPKVPTDRNVSFYGHYRECEHFVKVIRGEEKELIVKKAEALNVMRALDAIYKSAELGEEVWIEDACCCDCKK